MKKLLTTAILIWAAMVRAQSVTLAWDASPSTGVSGYRVYYGLVSSNYTFVTNAGLVRTQTVALPHPGRWFFAATAVSTNGIESAFSNEVQWEAKPGAPSLHGETWVRLTPVIERSKNLVDWVNMTGTPTWFQATNAMEFFATKRLLIERVQQVREP